MIKNLLVITLSISTIIANAQVLIFSEDFNSGVIPGNFATYDFDGLTVNPTIQNICPFTGSFVVCQYLGETFAASPSLFNSPGTANDWIVTPAISLANNNNSKLLKFDVSSADPIYNDGVEVYVSTTGNTPADFLNTTALYNSTAGGEPAVWTTRNIDLSLYSGQTIYIAFRNHSYNKLVLGIDNIEVSELSDNNIELTSLNFPQYTTIPTMIDIDGVITNVGGNTINSMDITWSDGTNSYTDNLSGLNILSNTTYNFTHNTQLNIISPGSITITVEVDNINTTVDPDTTNNYLSSVVQDVPFIPTKRVVIEESSGAWCPFCPQGIVGMETIEQQFPNTVIPIAVHNGDIMTNTIYDAGMNMTNWPSARIDRAILANGTQAVTAAGFLAHYNERIKVFAPVELTASANFNSSNREITVNITGDFAIDLFGDYRFNAVILEHQVGPYNQANNYVGDQPPLVAPISGINFSTASNPANIIHNNVARAILGGFNGVVGSLPATILENSTHTYQYTHVLPSNENENNIEIVCMVINNNNGEILNGIKVDLEMSTNIHNNIKDNQIILYPNPVKKELKLEGDFTTVEIYDGIGKLVLGPSNKKSFNISSLNNGIYTAIIKTKKHIISKKFTIQK
tara:strand:+ start:259 stop:2145 length:1887 start_codon:yes stop_codon:yes gene_type:complete